MSAITFDVGKLKKIIDGLPDEMPILIERIQDDYFSQRGGWEAIAVEWDKHDTTEGIEPFWAYVTRDEVGNEYLLIHAHY